MPFFSSFRALSKAPHLVASVLVTRDLQPFIRLHFLFAAAESGLLKALDPPAGADEIVQKLNVKNWNLLESFLHLGTTLGEIELRRGKYRLSGLRARALSRPEGDSLLALIQEFVTYHSNVYRNVSERLRGGPLGEYLQGTGTLIARSSRMIEPILSEFVKQLIRSLKPTRILEIGCGSGVYLRVAGESYSPLTGIGVDLQEDVVRHARSNLHGWGMRDRFKILQADIRTPPKDIAGPFDLVTLYNNVYYFDLEERRKLFRQIRGWLSPAGRFALVSMMQGNGAAACDFDVILQSTLGCAPLPELAALVGQLKDGGFSKIKTDRFIPNEPLYGVIAR